MIQQTRSDPQNGKHSQTKEMMHTRAERKGRLMRNSKRSTLIGMCINVVFCAALLAGCGGGGSSSAGPADSNAAKQTVHEETVIHADPPVNPMFEAKFVLTGKTHEEWMSQVTNPAFTERTEVYDWYEHVIEEPVMLSVLPVHHAYCLVMDWLRYITHTASSWTGSKAFHPEQRCISMIPCFT